MFQIHAVTADQPFVSLESLADRIVALLPYVDAVQIREKSRTPKALMELIDHIAFRAHDLSKIKINDRADIALAMGIDGVHLTESSLPIARLKAAFPTLSFGRSFHSTEDLLASLEDYDYGYIGHIFPTQQKDYPPFGLDNLRRFAAQKKGGTLIAIGGMNEQTIGQVAPFVEGAAVMSGFFGDQSIDDSILHAQKLRALALAARL